jgi:hypothetical protein
LGCYYFCFHSSLTKSTGKKRGLAASSESSQSADENEEDEDTQLFTPFEGARPDADDEEKSLHNESFQAPKDDSFIVEDNEPTAELPVEYSMNTHQDLAHHFKIICQLFVYLAVRPVAERRSFMEDAMKSEIASLFHSR